MCFYTNNFHTSHVNFSFRIPVRVTPFRMFKAVNLIKGNNPRIAFPIGVGFSFCDHKNEESLDCGIDEKYIFKFDDGSQSRYFIWICTVC